MYISFFLLKQQVKTEESVPESRLHLLYWSASKRLQGQEMYGVFEEPLQDDHQLHTGHTASHTGKPGKLQAGTKSSRHGKGATAAISLGAIG